MKHTATYTTVNYPRAAYAQRVEWACSCGKKGAAHDGQQPATLRRARSAHRRHVAAAAKAVAA